MTSNENALTLRSQPMINHEMNAISGDLLKVLTLRTLLFIYCDYFARWFFPSSSLPNVLTASCTQTHQFPFDSYQNSQIQTFYYACNQAFIQSSKNKNMRCLLLLPWLSVDDFSLAVHLLLDLATLKLVRAEDSTPCQ